MSMMLRWGYRLLMNMTEAEKALETGIVRLGVRYRAQYPFLGLKLFADFALLDDMLIIEVDGASHDKPAQKLKDLDHMIGLKSLGWDVVRVSNEEAMANPLEKAVAARSAPRTDMQALVEARQRLLRDYPSLLEPRAKKPKRGRRRTPSRKSGSGKSRSTRSAPRRGSR